MDDTPLLPPDPLPEAPGLPWEAPGPLLPRAWATLKVILQDPAGAGARLGARKALLPALTFAAWVGLPFRVLEQVLVVLWTPLDGGVQMALLRKAGLPVPPPPTPEQLEMARTLRGVQGVVAVALAPFLLVLGYLLVGLLAHGGLWLFRGASRERGLEATFRSVIFVGAATAWVWCLVPAGLLLPESLQGLYLVANLGLTLGVMSYQGLVLAHAHGTEPWRGICGVLVPWVALFCCLGACLGAALGAAGRVG